MRGNAVRPAGGEDREPATTALPMRSIMDKSGPGTYSYFCVGRRTALDSVMARATEGTEVADCLECRIVGSSAMLGLSAYFASHCRAAGSRVNPTHRRFTAAMSAAFALAGVARFFA